MFPWIQVCWNVLLNSDNSSLVTSLLMINHATQPTNEIILQSRFAYAIMHMTRCLPIFTCSSHSYFIFIYVIHAVAWFTWPQICTVCRICVCICICVHLPLSQDTCKEPGLGHIYWTKSQNRKVNFGWKAFFLLPFGIS